MVMAAAMTLRREAGARWNQILKSWLTPWSASCSASSAAARKATPIKDHWKLKEQRSSRDGIAMPTTSQDEEDQRGHRVRR
jgi:hypothetical protein